MKVTFPHLGTMHIFCKAIAETAGIPYIVPPETSRFAKRLNTNVAQFSILTPYPGTAIYEQVKDRIFRWRAPWSFFDMQHLVFKHDHLSFIRMEWLLLKAHLLYYTRSKKGFRISGITLRNIVWVPRRSFVF